MTHLADAERSLRDGDLDGALVRLQDAVRREPAKAAYRTFLFQLLAVRGEWQRAERQLGVVGDLDAAALPMVQTYREALHAEALRADVFAGRRQPHVLGRPEPWFALLLEALRLTAAGEHGAAGEARARAFEEAPASAGTIDGARFAWIADADTRIGPALEVILSDGYYWVPFSRVRRVEIEPPADLRDLVWTPAIFTWTNEGQTVGLIPTRYPGSEASPDSGVRLARRTEWREPAPEVFLGLGQRLLATDAGDHALLDVRRIELDAAEEDAATGGGEAATGGGGAADV